MSRVLLFIAVGVAVILLIVIPIKAMQTVRENPETGQVVDSRFVSSYKDHGGFEIFGYPISEAIVDQETGKTVQYFENGRLDLILDEQGETVVKVAALGMMLGGWEAPVSNTGEVPGCHFYEETGHRVCHVFLEYYNRHGGPEVFGFPISEIQLKEDRVVQYFHRFRLDWSDDGSEAGVVKPGPLGRIYLEMIAPEALHQTEPSSEAVGLLVTTSIENASTPSTGEQTLYLRVRDHNDQPVEGAAATLIAHFPEGDRIIVMPLTDEHGRSQATFTFENQPPGINIYIDLMIVYGALKKETRESFMISLPDNN